MFCDNRHEGKWRWGDASVTVYACAAWQQKKENAAQRICGRCYARQRPPVASGEAYRRVDNDGEPRAKKIDGEWRIEGQAVLAEMGGRWVMVGAVEVEGRQEGCVERRR